MSISVAYVCLLSLFRGPLIPFFKDLFSYFISSMSVLLFVLHLPCSGLAWQGPWQDYEIAGCRGPIVIGSQALDMSG